ncbi:MAG TPA: beta-glucanase, partial [Acetivibrio sp.]|nr:beta-glucanase [Acetivibrio sp.]
MYKRVISLLTASLLTVSLLFVLPAIISPSSGVNAANVVTTPFEAVFSDFDSSLWEKASWANGSVFNCVWKPSQVTFS